MLLLVFLMVK